ncbi:helix-turn-helix domain-containing protein [Rhodococcus rhodochrous]|uniref:helix-turn-helix domain-containing protein n=1 Tax=Rhodococcus rhodochrous TaxID=1829 RepID=UPI000313E19C|nr:helix-turn-helix transcriptional regulator [Rhodococcus rhodochrous]
MAYEQLNQFLGAEIRGARARLRMSQDELANAVGLAKATISRIECGERAAKAEHLVLIGESLGVPATELVQLARDAHDAAMSADV